MIPVPSATHCDQLLLRPSAMQRSRGKTWIGFVACALALSSPFMAQIPLAPSAYHALTAWTPQKVHRQEENEIEPTVAQDGYRRKGKDGSLLVPEALESNNSNHSLTCIYKGAVEGAPHAIPLSSPFFGDGLFFSPAVPSSSCAGMTADLERRHVFFSVKHLQYGHFLLNGLAPLWDRLRPRPEDRSKWALHLFLADGKVRWKPYVQRLLPFFGDGAEIVRPPYYIQRYLSFFGDEAEILRSRDVNETTVLAADPVLGLGNVTLDHYNKDADPALWRGFRDFLIRGFGIKHATDERMIRVTFVQRDPKASRQFLEMAGVIADVRQWLSNRSPLQEAVVQVQIFERLSVDGQAQVMSETDILVGADGTGLINGIYMPDRSCVVSVLPFGVRELIPHKGQNFENMFRKLGMMYIALDSFPVEGSDEVYAKAANITDVMGRWFMLKQNVRVNRTQLLVSLNSCLEARKETTTKTGS